MAIEINRLTGGHTSAEPEFAKKGHWAPDTGFDVPGLGHLYSRTLGLITVKADNVVIEGLRLHMGIGAAVIVYGNDVTIRDCYITGSHLGICQPDEVKLPPRGDGPRLITPSSRTGRGLKVEYCEFSTPPGFESCRRGFWAGLYAANISGVFMNYGGPRSIVRHNWVYDFSQDHLQPRGNNTSAPEDTSEVSYNLFQNSGDDSIEFDSASPMNLRVHHNVILDAMCLLALSPVMGGGLTIDHNILYVSPEHGLEWCAMFKGGSPWGSGLPTQGVRIVHNTMVNMKGHDIGLWWVGGHRYENMILENNIFYIAQSQDFSAPGLVFSPHNLYCGLKVDPKHIPGMMHYDGSPFVSMNPIDFALRADGPAVDAGVSGTDYHHEASGKVPDLGAIELGQNWQFPHPGPRWARGNNIPNRPAIPASLPLRWVGQE